MGSQAVARARPAIERFPAKTGAYFAQGRRADPTKSWSPRATRIADAFLLARASQQVLLPTLSQRSLLDAARRAQEDGTVYSIAPNVRQRRSVFVALLVSGAKPREIEYGMSMR